MVYGLFYILTYYGCRSPEIGLLLFGPPVSTCYLNKYATATSNSNCDYMIVGDR